jgi:glycosyltransferase involved in cell wall biosynthesis
MARALRTALAPLYNLSVVSRLSSRDGTGDLKRQSDIQSAAAEERHYLRETPPPAIWLTYHNYYKAPDLLGPSARRRGAVYALVEASRSRKRLIGPWAGFAAAAETASDAADIVFHLTARDQIALEAWRPPHQRLVLLRPFLPIEALPPRHSRRPENRLALITVAMMRSGDKVQSYSHLAQALKYVRCAWRLTIVGDGPARHRVQNLFAPFGTKVAFKGQLQGATYDKALADAEVFVWPGVNEAFGMVYLEAQSQGLCVVAENRPGVRDVARAGAILTAPAEPESFAAAIDLLGDSFERRQSLSIIARNQIEADHLIGSARTTLFAALDEAITEKGRRR